ncbi:MAG: adenosylcobinamide-GDP ribazoletransferase [Lachnospiraceae bacterium]|nr:adenosylcobinamide-GDP ribazoletransferase [Lachnospiraceae bacterium]
MPQVRWEKENMRFSMCAFPLIGILTGAVMWLFCSFCVKLSFPDILRAAGLTLIPVWISGGIHLDGYLDVSDALASRGDIKKRLAILKDPGIGAFAAIRLVCLMITELALWASCPEAMYDPVLTMLIFVFSRCLSGLSVLTFKFTEGSTMASMFSDSGRAEGRAARIVQLCECVIAAVLLCLKGMRGAACIVTAVIIFLYYKYMSEKKFGGLNGDQAGWFLTVSEAWMIAVTCLLPAAARIGGVL